MNHKLTDDQVKSIRNLYTSRATKKSWSKKELARAFGTSIRVISHVLEDRENPQGYQGYPNAWIPQTGSLEYPDSQ